MKAIFVSLLAGGLSLIAISVAAEMPADDWSDADYAVHARSGAAPTLERTVMSVVYNIRNYAGADGVLDDSDLRRARGMVASRQFGRTLGQWLAHDLDMNLVLDPNELAGVPTHLATARSVNRIDKNSDGSVSVNELSEHARRALATTTERDISQRFIEGYLRLDPNEDRRIDASEREGLARAIFALADVNNDGVVTNEDASPR